MGRCQPPAMQAVGRRQSVCLRLSLACWRVLQGGRRAERARLLSVAVFSGASSARGTLRARPFQLPAASTSCRSMRSWGGATTCATMLCSRQAAGGVQRLLPEQVAAWVPAGLLGAATHSARRRCLPAMQGAPRRACLAGPSRPPVTRPLRSCAPCVCPCSCPAVQEMAPRYGSLVDIYSHFLAGERSWLTHDIEPSFEGASEVIADITHFHFRVYSHSTARRNMALRGSAAAFTHLGGYRSTCS